MIGSCKPLPGPATHSFYLASMSRATRLFFCMVFAVTFVVVFLQMTASYTHMHKISPWKLGQYTQQQFKAAVSSTRPSWRTVVRLGSTQPTIGTCTVAHGKHVEGYERALQTHLAHSEFHGYPSFLLDHPILDGLWSKESALLDVVLIELSKPPTERLEWLIWFDADTVVMNKLIPLEVFLPPKDREDVQMLYTKDWNGLNNGVFLMRISSWSLEMLSSIIAYRSFRPDEKLQFTEQSAMDRVLKMDKYKDGAVEVPPQWFNAYPADGGDKNVHYDYRPGQLLVHFAGIVDKSKAIGEWLDKLEKDPSAWELPLKDTTYEAQIQAFWDENGKAIKSKQDDDKKKAEEKQKADEEKKKVESAKAEQSKLNDAIKAAADKKKLDDQKEEEKKKQEEEKKKQEEEKKKKQEEEKQKQEEERLRKEAEKKEAEERKVQEEPKREKREIWDGLVL